MRFGSIAFQALMGGLIFAVPVMASAEPVTQRIGELKPGIGEVELRLDGFVHKPSGYNFPKMLGELPARKTTTYGPENADVYYTLYGGGNGDGWLNLYVYPARISLADEVTQVSQSIIENMGGKPIAPLAQFGRAPEGVSEGWYVGSTQNISLLSGFRVTRVGGWFIKARVSIPTSAGESTLNRIAAALNAVDFLPANLNVADVAEAAAP